MSRNNEDKNKKKAIKKKAMRLAPHIPILGVIGVPIVFVIVVFWGFSNEPALMRNLTPFSFSVVVLLAYGIGVVWSISSTIRVKHAEIWAVLVLALTAVSITILPIFDIDQDVSLDALLGHLTAVAIPGVILTLFLFFRRDIQRRLQHVTGIDAFGVRASFSQEGRLSSVALTSFDDLMRAVSDLIRRAEAWDTIRFTAYTPALGYLARAEREWSELQSLLKLNAHRVSMTCLDETHLRDWHRGFEGKVTPRGEVDRTLADSATTASENLLKFIDAKRINPGKEPFLHRYLFASEKRAIVVVPFFVPKFFSPELEPRLDLRGTDVEEDRFAEMLGFVTEDPRLVDMVCRAHDLTHRISAPDQG